MKAKEEMASGGLFETNYDVALLVEESDFIFASILLRIGLIVAISLFFL